MSDEPCAWQCERVIQSDTAAGRQVLDEVLRALEACHWVEHDIFGIQLAVEEALVNAIRHGNHGDPRKQVRVKWHVSPALFRIEIADEGAGFDPAQLPNPTAPDRLEAPDGRGLLLMKAFMSSLDYAPPGNRVVMEKRPAGA